MMKQPTQKDVAKRAGVSRSTVSYVLNDQNDLKIAISPETRQRVMDAIVALGYEPDSRAQSLRSGKTKTFGVLIPTFENPYFAQMLNGIQLEAQSAGYSLHLSQSFESPEQEHLSLTELVQHPADAFIVVTSFELVPLKTFKRIEKSGVPVAAISLTNLNIDHVLNGYAEGTRSLMEYLIALGHRRIGFIYGVAVEEQGYDRLPTYYQVLQEAGVPRDESLVERCGYNVEDGYQAALRSLSRENRPTALLVINDYLAIGVMRAAFDLGLDVPADVSIASFDDIPFAQYTVPRLTTVSTFPEQNGRDVVRLVLARLADPHAPHTVIPSGSKVHIRESTGVAPTQLRAAKRIPSLRS